MLTRLVDQGNTVIVIEHNLDVIKTADWIIDMGPEGGSGGGQIVAEGSPEQIAAVAESHTGGFLKTILPGRSGTTTRSQAKAKTTAKTAKPATTAAARTKPKTQPPTPIPTTAARRTPARKRA